MRGCLDALLLLFYVSIPMAGGAAFLFSPCHSKTVGAPLLSLLQGRVRCCVYHEIFEEVKTDGASCIVPTLRKVREGWGIHFYCLRPRFKGRATRQVIN